MRFGPPQALKMWFLPQKVGEKYQLPHFPSQRTETWVMLAYWTYEYFGRKVFPFPRFPTPIWVEFLNLLEIWVNDPSFEPQSPADYDYDSVECQLRHLWRHGWRHFQKISFLEKFNRFGVKSCEIWYVKPHMMSCLTDILYYTWFYLSDTSTTDTSGRIWGHSSKMGDKMLN